MSPHEPGHGNPPEERGKDRGDGDGGPTGTGAGIPGRTARDQPWAPPAGQPGDPQQPGWPAPAWNGPGTWQQPTQPQQWPQNPPYPSGETSRPGAPYAGQPYNGAPYGGQPYPGSPHNQPPHYAGPLGAGPYGQARYVAPPKPGIIPLRPLMFGEILDGSFQSLRRNAKAMLGAGLLAQSLSAILAAVLTGVLATSSGTIESWAKTASRTDVASLGIGLMVTFAVLSILSVFMSVVLQGAMVVPVARSVLNRPTGFRRMLSLVRPRIGALAGLAAVLVAAALAAMALFFALIVLLFSNVRGAAALLVIPLMFGFAAVFLWVAIKLMVAPAAVVIEELGALAGLRRSWELTRTNWWRILGITLVVGILVAVITQVVLIPASLLPTVLSGVVSPHGGSGQDATLTVAVSIITAVVGALVGAVGYAFQTSVMALLYMDLRMRKDGLDIALLRDMETGADPDGIPGRKAVAANPYPGYGTAPGAWPDGR
ncbi:hypothetical protein [Pseudarthrobacter sp. NIBRBAC000502771]|uniref:DUF7847 domain-containing protein n=1 Tax=Pseudarthrobacter sp. NIBRBAC000502771 TaxID=2590774 RepID=UPI001FED6E13|nr:hypothetical protein [Pseudarthrobacter sp. NIBRBAC000502771]